VVEIGFLDFSRKHYLATTLMHWIIYHIAKLILIFTLPFIVLVRGSVYIHENYDPGARLSIIGGVVVTAFLLLIYLVVMHRLKSEIRSLNPILRLAVGTLVMIDKEAVITDTNRVPEDYKKMGLKTNKSSLHYEQKDGYANAIDLRVRGKSEIRNKLTQWYFDWMGFNTLRHGGTGDHLHVSLPCHYRRGAI